MVCHGCFRLYIYISSSVMSTYILLSSSRSSLLLQRVHYSTAQYSIVSIVQRDFNRTSYAMIANRVDVLSNRSSNLINGYP